MTSHPIYFTLYWCYFCHHIHSIDDITPNLFMRSHPLCMSTSYPLYATTYSLYIFHHIHCTCVSHPHFPWYHTLCIYDIARTICLTSDTLYKVSHPPFMTSRHIIYDITCTVFMSSLPRYLTLPPQYLCPHNPSKYDLWTTVCMTSHHFIYDILCTIYNITFTLWVHTIVVTTLHPLYSWHHTQYRTSHKWQQNSYICHLTLYIWHYINCNCVIKPSVSVVLHPLALRHYTIYVWHCIQYTWHHMNTL